MSGKVSGRSYHWGIRTDFIDSSWRETTGFGQVKWQGRWVGVWCGSRGLTWHRWESGFFPGAGEWRDAWRSLLLLPPSYVHILWWWWSRKVKMKREVVETLNYQPCILNLSLIKNIKSRNYYPWLMAIN